VVFVPGVVAREEVAALADALGPRRLSVISVPGRSLPVRELQELGVARVSTGPFTQQGGADGAAGRRRGGGRRRDPAAGDPPAELTGVG
jgi:2-methylisocitrate lyase-like PEP mutase family enzyme